MRSRGAGAWRQPVSGGSPRQRSSRRAARPARRRRGADGVSLLLALRQTITDVLGIPLGSAATGLALTTELDADLLLDVTLVVEDAYQVRFSEAELRRLSCLHDIADCLDQRRRHLAVAPVRRPGFAA